MYFRSRARLRALVICAAGLAAPAHAQSLEGAVSGVTVIAKARDAEAPLAKAGTNAATIAATVNAFTVEDALKTLPSILVRRRHIGDTQAPITTRTSGVGSSARSLIYADGVLLSALIGNNNSTASPRWGMVRPEEIETVEVLYGPFSAAYAGNSIGAVVNITTRTPDHFTVNARAAVASQAFDQYGVHKSYPTTSVSLGLGDRTGSLAWRLAYDRLESRGQPLGYATASTPTSASSAGTPAAGAFDGRNRTAAPIVVLGATGLEQQAQDNAKLKLEWPVASGLTLFYLAGYFGNDTRAHSQSFLRDAAGQPVYAGNLNIAGRAYAVAASAFSSGVYRQTQHHWMQAAGADWAVSPEWTIRARASLYDYARDLQRSPTSALPSAELGGAGAVVDMGGTGWRTFDLTVDGKLGAHRLGLGAHLDRYVLESDRYATTDWRRGPGGPLTSASHGHTATSALWAEDVAALTPDVDLMLGARWERWRAAGGFNYSASPLLSVRQLPRSADRLSPKAGLTWRPDPAWAVQARAGVAYRFPTTSELYQAVTTGQTLSVPDPDLRPERALSTELSTQRVFERASLRASLFTEDLKDALIAQTAPLTPASSLTANYVQNVPKVRSHGVELVGEARDVGVDGLDLSASATWVHARIRRDDALPAAVGKRLPQVPEWRATAAASWRASERLTLSAVVRYGARSYGNIDNSDVVTHTYQGFDSYLVADIRAVWRFNHHWSAAVGVDNLGGRDYFLFHPFPQRSAMAELKFVQ